jgi:hypothetical protein
MHDISSVRSWKADLLQVLRENLAVGTWWLLKYAASMWNEVEGMMVDGERL